MTTQEHTESKKEIIAMLITIEELLGDLEGTKDNLAVLDRTYMQFLDALDMVG